MKKKKTAARRKKGIRIGVAPDNSTFRSPFFILVSITLNFRALTTPEKVLARLRFHIHMLTGNPHFPVTDPGLILLGNKAVQLENAIDMARSGDHLLIEARNILVKEVKELIRELSYDIQKQSHGDIEKIHSAGFETRRTRTGCLPCSKVVITSVRNSANQSIRLKWRTVTDAFIYLVEISTGPYRKRWFLAGKTRKQSITISKYKVEDEWVLLEPGVKYRFRVYAWNVLGDGEYSEVAERYCI